MCSTLLGAVSNPCNVWAVFLFHRKKRVKLRDAPRLRQRNSRLYGQATRTPTLVLLCRVTPLLSSVVRVCSRPSPGPSRRLATVGEEAAACSISRPNTQPFGDVQKRQPVSASLTAKRLCRDQCHVTALELQDSHPSCSTLMLSQRSI